MSIFIRGDFLSQVVNGLGGRNVKPRERDRNAQGEISIWMAPRSGELSNVLNIQCSTLDRSRNEAVLRPAEARPLMAGGSHEEALRNRKLLKSEKFATF